MFLSSLGGLVLGTIALLLLVTVALAAVRPAVRRLVAAHLPAPRTGRARAAHLGSALSDRVTDTRTHPCRPRAPGIA